MDAVVIARILGEQDLPRIHRVLETYRDHYEAKHASPRDYIGNHTTLWTDELWEGLGQPYFDERGSTVHPNVLSAAKLPGPIVFALLGVWNRQQPSSAFERFLLFEAIDKALALIREVLTGSPHSPPADGCYPGDILNWNGERHKLTPQSWKILSYCWNGEPVTFDDAGDMIWECETNWGAIRTAVTRLNNELMALGIFKDITVNCKGRCITVSFPPPDVVTDLLQTT